MTSYPSRRSPRLHDYDYSTAGAYFVTLCIQNRLPLLGHVEDDTVHLSPAGQMVASVWANLEPYYGVGVDAYVVMPNHVHGILVVPDRGATQADRDGATVPTNADRGREPLNVSTVIQRFKTFTMHEYGSGVREAGWLRYPGRLWQHRFYDRVIRNERELNAIRQYIADNPQNWHLDRLNSGVQ